MPAASEIGPERIVRRDGGVERLGHPGDQTALGDAAGVTEVRLQDRRRLLLEDFPEAPLGEDAFAGGDRQVRAARDVGHHIDFLAVHRLLDEHRLIRLQRLDEQPRGLLADGAVEVDADVAFVADGGAQFGEALRRFVDERLVLDDARRTFLERVRS